MNPPSQRRPVQRLGLWLGAAIFAAVATAASCGFMLPVGTAPNAIVYGSGRVSMRDMMRAGLPLDILAAVVVVAVSPGALRWLV
jgi:sodium-dependent dicarboxylate transporter 2/3/5